MVLFSFVPKGVPTLYMGAQMAWESDAINAQYIIIRARSLSDLG